MGDSLDRIREIKALIAELETRIRAARAVYYELPADASAAEREAARIAFDYPQIEQAKLRQQLDSFWPRD